MDIAKIKEIANASHLPDDIKELSIINVLSEDKKVIPMLMEILESERVANSALISESNLELSRALVALKDPNLMTRKPIIETKFVVDKIMEHYLKWQHRIRCCFHIDELPD